MVNGERSARKIHHGRNIKRFREMFGLKQEALALELGDDWSQKKVSRLEENETVEDAVLEQVAEIFKIPVEAIKHFDEAAIINIISNTVNNNDHATGNALFSYCPTINPVERWTEALEENKKLYERLLTSEREKVEILKKMLSQKND
jgi:transcriptional regulator with XRE-family HTH domain